ncbi:hypothetical protein MS3_00006111 [Schistosoma haematobium]|uniref:Male-enhanced antigen 1 n=1 Tax=Schistosoma haematobium TaxID=6185 RepID=A0A095AI42_SCHHA|nr:hypothetical protein MS3_00006111 [Schistosoma haematobium]KAH9584551.1 hypothetical protein MS3_00006111 [Schistosoma haematobium]CAH8502316.1 unnamed protein product [Schistosoma haematobium]CAH8504722.1 unnamed protein product [Schistosoma haematobium]
MVMKKFSEPSSPNPNDEIGDNHNDNYINGIENNEDIIDSTVIPVGYALLGSEIVHMADDNIDDNNNDSEINDLSDSENDEIENNNVISQHLSNSQSIGFNNYNDNNNSDPVNLQVDVDNLLNRHLSRTEFEPRGAFTASNLCTNTIDDSSHIELWNQNTPASTSQITITPDEADKIKMYMSNFHLPISQYPTWATQIPEELWKSKLLEKIQHNYKP